METFRCDRASARNKRQPGRRGAGRRCDRYGADRGAGSRFSARTSVEVENIPGRGFAESAPRLALPRLSPVSQSLERPASTSFCRVGTNASCRRRVVRICAHSARRDGRRAETGGAQRRAARRDGRRAETGGVCGELARTPRCTRCPASTITDAQHTQTAAPPSLSKWRTLALRVR
jgi:hypothetical protein